MLFKTTTFTLLAALLSGSSSFAQDLESAANTAFNLEDSAIVQVETEGDLDGTIHARFELEGRPVELELERFSIRADDFELRIQQPDGTFQTDENPGPVRTVRGTVVGAPGSLVAGSFLPDGLSLRIRFADGRDEWLEPVAPKVSFAAANDYVYYSTEDVADRVGQRCGADDIPNNTQVPPSGTGGGNTAAAGVLYLTETAFETDIQMYNDFNQDAQAVMDFIANVFNTMNVQYESEVQIRHVIGTINIRTMGGPPYDTTNPSTLLNRFRNEWNANFGGVQRDVAHYFTGKNIDGGVIGIAFLGVICTGNGYGIVQRLGGSLACQTDLSAHELGHNWNAGHCSNTCNFTMNSFLQCANHFRPVSRNVITSHRNSRTCLEQDTGCAAVANYCTGAVNSDGTMATMSFSGSQIVGDNNVTVSVSEAATNKAGLFYYGPNQTMTAFGDGFRCVSGATYRLQPIVQTDGFGFADKVVDLNNPPAPGGLITAGSTWNFQFWYRDPMGPGGSGFNLSDGLEVPFCQ